MNNSKILTTVTRSNELPSMSTPLQRFIDIFQPRIEKQLSELFTAAEAHNTPLLESMRYSLLNGGKRIRPMLVYAAAEACQSVSPVSDAFAAAIECVHVYSLIHDDLPAMDDDELRRGKPTNHIAFDEATAILAGDALQTLAFETLSKAPCQAESRLEAIQILAHASGMQGMVMGQAIDLHAVATSPSLDRLQHMHLHKTGALIEAATLLGAISAQATAQQKAALKRFAQAIGLAFQVQDDILDVVSDTETLGKAQGADAERNKPTYVSLMGLKQAQQKAETLYQEAIEALAPFGEKANMLNALAQYIIQRRH